jgi:hypothetical protein
VTGSRRHLSLLVAATGAVSALQFALIDRGGFFLDDFVNLAEARRLGLSGSLLVEPVYQHFAPGHRVLDWLVAVPFDNSYTAAVIILVLFIAGSVVSLTLLLDECFGRRDLHVVFAAAAAGSWTITETAGWFAAAAHSLPSIFLTETALLFFVRWYRRRRRSDYLIALAVFLLSLMFWELSLLFVVIAPLLVALLLERHDSAAAVARSLLRAVTPLLPFAALAIAYLLYVDAQPWHQAFDRPTTSQLRYFTQVFVLRGWLPPLVGTGTGIGSLSSFQRLMQELSLVLVAGGLVAAVATSRAVVRGLVFLFVTFAVVWFSIAGYRLHVVGQWVGNTSRLIAPLPFLFWLAVGFMLQPAAGRQFARLPRLRLRLRPRARDWWPARLAPVVILALAVAYVFNLKHTDDVQSYNRVAGAEGTAWAARTERGVIAAKRRGLLDSFVESPVPMPLAFPGRWDDTLWRMGAYFDSGIHALGEQHTLLTINTAGAVQENTFTPAHIRGRGQAMCPKSGGCTTPLVARHPLPASPAYVRVTIWTSGPTRLRLASQPAAQAQDPTEGRRGYDDTTSHLVLGSGRHTLVLALWASGVTSASITATGSPLRIHAQLGVLSPGRLLS